MSKMHNPTEIRVKIEGSSLAAIVKVGQEYGHRSLSFTAALLLREALEARGFKQPRKIAHYGKMRQMSQNIMRELAILKAGDNMPVDTEEELSEEVRAVHEALKELEEARLALEEARAAKHEVIPA